MLITSLITAIGSNWRLWSRDVVRPWQYYNHRNDYFIYTPSSMECVSYSIVLEVGGPHGLGPGVAGVGTGGAGARPLSLRPARRPITAQPYDFTLPVRPNDPFYFFYTGSTFLFSFRADISFDGIIIWYSVWYFVIERWLTSCFILFLFVKLFWFSVTIIYLAILLKTNKYILCSS